MRLLGPATAALAALLPARAWAGTLVLCPLLGAGGVDGKERLAVHQMLGTELEMAPEVDDLKSRYRTGKVGDVEVKTKLANALNAHLEPIRQRRAAVLAKPDRLKEILYDGSKRVRTVAKQTMERVRDAMRIAYK